MQLAAALAASLLTTSGAAAKSPAPVWRLDFSSARTQVSRRSTRFPRRGTGSPNRRSARSTRPSQSFARRSAHRLLRRRQELLLAPASSGVGRRKSRPRLRCGRRCCVVGRLAPFRVRRYQRPARSRDAVRCDVVSAAHRRSRAVHGLVGGRPACLRPAKATPSSPQSSWFRARFSQLQYRIGRITSIAGRKASRVHVRAHRHAWHRADRCERCAAEPLRGARAPATGRRASAGRRTESTLRSRSWAFSRSRTHRASVRKLAPLAAEDVAWSPRGECNRRHRRGPGLARLTRRTGAHSLPKPARRRAPLGGVAARSRGRAFLPYPIGALTANGGVAAYQVCSFAVGTWSPGSPPVSPPRHCMSRHDSPQEIPRARSYARQRRNPLSRSVASGCSRTSTSSQQSVSRMSSSIEAPAVPAT